MESERAHRTAEVSRVSSIEMWQRRPELSRHSGHEETQEPIASHDPRDTAGAGEQQALGKQLPHETPRPRADRGTEPHLVGPAAPAGNEETCHTRASRHEHEPDGSQDHEQCGTHAADDPFAKRPEAHHRSSVPSRIGGRQPAREVVEIGLRLFSGDPWREPANRVEPVPVARSSCWREGTSGSHNSVSPRSGNSNVSGSTPMTGVRLGVDRDAPPDERRIAAESALPRAMAQHHHALGTRFDVGAIERAAENRSDAKRLEKPIGHFTDWNPLDRSGCGQRPAAS